jgi:hypothetical protein
MECQDEMARQSRKQFKKEQLHRIETSALDFLPTLVR